MMRAFRNDDGVAIVELALIAPFLILLTVGIIDVGRFTRDGIEVGNAARAGAAYAAFNVSNSTDASGIASAATSDASDVKLLSTDVSSSTYCSCGATPGTHVAACTPTPSCAASDHIDSFVTVTVTKSFGALISFPGLPSTLTIARTATQEISP